ncbi:hypothetical protein ACQCQ6_21825, partial [Ralstonia pseudosolanacearum]|uniref:hypothetical protein n=4 Tax=Ralstonia pseudosolanacearum TaxID=1310165 RepID=UPI003CE7DAB5
MPVPPLMRTGRPDPAGPRDSRRCAVAAATVVLVGAAPLAAHAARPSAGSQDDAASAATRRLIDAELAELNDGTAAASRRNVVFLDEDAVVQRQPLVLAA